MDRINQRVIKVNYFQRRIRKGFNFSLEYIYEDIRNRLKEKVLPEIYFSRCYNDGYFSKLVNIMEAALRQGKDVNHITGEVHFLNFFMNKNKVVLTILDCGMMLRKKGIAKELVKWLYFSIPVSRAKFITAISEETKTEIIRITNCEPDKIKVIPVAISPIYKPYPKEFNAVNPVIMHIGTGSNKNIFRLIEALNGIKCHLTIVGKISPQHLAALKLNNIDYSNDYNISNERLLEKYIECDILTYISTSEGFGMPIIEANAVERVVITSNVSSMPEVAGKSACLVDPYNVEEIRNAVLKVIGNPEYREELIREGRINKLRFNADTIAGMYYDLYNEIAV